MALFELVAKSRDDSFERMAHHLGNWGENQTSGLFLSLNIIMIKINSTMIFASTVFRFVKLPKDLSLPPRQQPGKSRSWCLTVSWQPSGGSNFNAIVKRQERDLEHSRIGQSGGNLPARVVWLQEVTSKQVFTRWLWLFVYSAWNIHGEIVDVAEQTWLGCRAFVASTSSSLLNWMAFVLFLNIWPNFWQLVKTLSNMEFCFCFLNHIRNLWGAF